MELAKAHMGTSAKLDQAILCWYVMVYAPGFRVQSLVIVYYSNQSGNEVNAYTKDAKPS